MTEWKIYKNGKKVAYGTGNRKQVITMAKKRHGGKITVKKMGFATKWAKMWEVK